MCLATYLAILGAQRSTNAQIPSYSCTAPFAHTHQCDRFATCIDMKLSARSILVLLASLPLLVLGLSTSSAPSTLPDRSPSWSDLTSQILETPTGTKLAHEAHLRSQGLGPPHVDATLRLFESTTAEDDVRVTLYRDSAAWCPYCQKVWICLEEKRIPYKCKTVPLNAYGDKPAWYTRLVDGGTLPAIELDGEVITESLDIIRLLDDTFPEHGSRMLHDADINTTGDESSNVVESLLQLEQELQSAWFSLVFYPVEGDALVKARENFHVTLKKVDDALGSTSGPWFLDTSTSPSIVDIQYISHMERIIASALYWKGIRVRCTGRFPYLDKWLDAFEERPLYIATKSDLYTLVMAMPSQNGPGYSIDEAKDVSSRIFGLDGAWSLPLNYDRMHECILGDEEAHRHEAAYALATKHAAVATFAMRGAGEPGRPSFHAELADPYAEPSEDYSIPVDICLRHITAALLDGTDSAKAADAAEDLAGRAGDGTLREYWDEYTDNDDRVYWWNEITGDITYAAPTKQLDTCLEYFRDRVGVPRDMGAGAAMQLRAHLNWAIDLLNREA